MEEIHKLLNHSFAFIDITGYISTFRLQRETKFSDFSNENLDQALANDDLNSIKNKIFNSYCNDVNSDPRTENGFETFLLLKWILKQCYLNNPKKHIYEQIVDKFQKKFENFHRLFSSYNINFQKQTENYQDINNYALFSIILSIRFLKKRNYNDFNTVLKLNDLLLFSKWPINKEDCQLTFFALVIETMILNKLYEL